MITAQWIVESLPSICKALRFFFPKKTAPVPFSALVVEDNEEDFDMLARLLLKRNIKVERASSGDMASGLVAHSFYDLILIDMQLPGMSGAALLRGISDQTPNSKFVIVCGEPTDLYSIPSNQFVGFIRKPAGLEAIENMLKTLGIDTK